MSDDISDILYDAKYISGDTKIGRPKDVFDLYVNDVKEEYHLELLPKIKVYTLDVNINLIRKFTLSLIINNDVVRYADENSVITAKQDICMTSLDFFKKHSVELLLKNLFVFIVHTEDIKELKNTSTYCAIDFNKYEDGKYEMSEEMVIKDVNSRCDKINTLLNTKDW